MVWLTHTQLFHTLLAQQVTQSDILTIYSPAKSLSWWTGLSVGWPVSLQSSPNHEPTVFLPVSHWSIYPLRLWGLQRQRRSRSAPLCLSASATWQQATGNLSECHRPDWLIHTHTYTQTHTHMLRHICLFWMEQERREDVNVFHFSAACDSDRGPERKGEVLSRGRRMNSSPLPDENTHQTGRQRERRDGCRSGWCDMPGQTWFFRQN